MNRIFTSLFVLICIISSQYANAQFIFSTDCSDSYLIRQIHITGGHKDSDVSLTYDKDRHVTSWTQGEGSVSETIDITWTPTKIVYSYQGYELITASLDEDGNTTSMTTNAGGTKTFNYNNGYLVSSVAHLNGAEIESCQTVWDAGNPTETTVNERGANKIYKFTFYDIPNNTNIDFGITQSSTVVSFGLPLGKQIKNLPKHIDTYYGSTLIESLDITYEFDSLNRPVKAVSNGTDYENNKNKSFTKTLTFSYDESFVPLSIAKPVVESSDDSQTYNIMGQKVNGQQKGIVIRGGKKYVIK